MDKSASVYGTLAVFCKYCNEISGSIKSGEFFD
jgi:hypothetical protein